MSKYDGLCSQQLALENKPRPRTCSVCGLGPCKFGLTKITSAPPVRYHLFGARSRYEPCGGMDDYCGTFDTLDQAAVYVLGSEHLDWWELAITTPRGDLVKAYTWERIAIQRSYWVESPL